MGSKVKKAEKIQGIKMKKAEIYGNHDDEGGEYMETKMWRNVEKFGIIMGNSQNKKTGKTITGFRNVDSCGQKRVTVTLSSELWVYRELSVQCSIVCTGIKEVEPEPELEPETETSKGHSKQFVLKLFKGNKAGGRQK